MPHFWMIRAGERGRLVNYFLAYDIVAIGWNEVGDISTIDDREKIKNKVYDVYKDENPASIAQVAGQIVRFRVEIDERSKVATYDPLERKYYIGKVISEYEWNEKLIEYFHIRKVKWESFVNRDDLTDSTKYALGGISTIFIINTDAEVELLEKIQPLIKDEIDIPISDKAVSLSEEAKASEVEEEFESPKKNIETTARDFIIDRLKNLSWSDFQELVAGLLRAMGYKTLVSKMGPDRGRDIVASFDGLGLLEPRVVVEVKHRRDKCSSDMIRSFIGGLRNGHKGIFVSLSGFSREAKYEGERANIPITLVDADLLVEMLRVYYDKLDPSTRALLPLTVILWPA